MTISEDDAPRDRGVRLPAKPKNERPKKVWRLEGVEVRAHDKSGARAELKRLIGRIPPGAKILCLGVSKTPAPVVAG